MIPVRQRLLIVVVCCALVAWFVGPPGRFLVVLLLLLFGPGYLLEQALLPGRTFSEPLLRLSLWLGLSLSSVAVLYGWATALGLPLTTPVLSLLALACGVGVIVLTWQHPSPSAPAPPAPSAPPRSQPLFLRCMGYGMWGVLLALFALTLWIRFAQIQDIVLPAWVDPVHHALMIRVATEQGQAPLSLRPYLPVDHLPYHWGYHVFTAVVVQLSGLPIPQVMLWEGQIFNALHMLTCAALAFAIWRSPLAAVVAGLIVGVVSIMPSYYVSWGRYTHLTGLLLLPPLAIVWQAWLLGESRRWLPALALLLAGLSIIHILILILAIVLLVVMGLLYALDRPWRVWLSRMSYGLASGLLAIVLAAPWMWVLIRRVVVPIAQAPGELVSGGDYIQIHEHLLWAGENRLLIALALAATLWGLWRRKRAALVFFGWAGLLFLLANPWTINYACAAIGLPLFLWGVRSRRFDASGAGLVLLLLNPAVVTFPYYGHITNDVVAISLFVPLSVLIGGGAHLLMSRLNLLQSLLWRWATRAGFAVALGAVALWGASHLVNIINPATILATPADAAAIEWVRENTPPDARFLINTTSWYPAADRGIDGGYWLMPLTGRWTSTPPSLFSHGPPDYVDEMQQLSRQVMSYQQGLEPQLDRIIQQHNISHIYLGQNQGALTTEAFAQRPAYEKVYEHKGVTIFAVNQQVLSTR